MDLSIRSLRPQDIQVFDNGWGASKPEGIKLGNVEVWLSDACLDALSVVVTLLVTEREIARAEEERDETRDCENQTGAYTVGLPKWVA